MFAYAPTLQRSCHNAALAFVRWLSALFTTEMVLLLSLHVVVRWRLRTPGAITIVLLGSHEIQSLIVHIHCSVAYRSMCSNSRLLFG